MTIRTKRLGSSADEPFTLEVASQLAAASGLLWHLSKKLPGLRVVAKKSWALTDDFEAYFLYKGRMFVMQTPLVNVWVSLLGQPADESLFSEVEALVRSYGVSLSPFSLVAWVCYCFLPANPSQELLLRYGAGPQGKPNQADNAL